MRNKRMFSLDIVDTDKFLEMSVSARLLYYDLGMRADDDGFVSSPRRIMRAIGAHDGDMKALIEAGYVHCFSSGIVVILDWKINNNLRSDRYTPTKFIDEKQYLQLCKNSHYKIIDPVTPISIATSCQDGATTGYQDGATTGYQGGATTGYQGGATTGYQGGATTGYQGGATTGYPRTVTETVTETVTATTTDIKKLLLKFGLSDDVVDNLLTSEHIANLSEDELKAIHRYAEQHAVSNVAGYFLALLKNKNFILPQQVAQEKHYDPNCPKCHGTGTYLQKIGDDSYSEEVEMKCDCYKTRGD